MGNVASVLSAYKRNILYPERSEFGCNCRLKTDFPLSHKYLTPKIVYQTDVRIDTNDERKFYFGVFETPFKELSEITRNNLLIRSMGIALNCQNIYGN